jgi:hypothetical protein
LEETQSRTTAQAVAQVAQALGQRSCERLKASVYDLAAFFASWDMEAGASSWRFG